MTEERNRLGSRSTRIAIGILLAIILAGALYWFTQSPAVGVVINYDPPFNPRAFVSQVTNKYFTLEPGRKFTYHRKTVRGIERTEVIVLKETKTVMGVATVVVWDRVWLNDKLEEDTRDWYAQDKDGNVWYFGEAVGNYVDGKLASYTGSWEAGVRGAKPGIVMPADPKVGLTYRQENARGEAEDMGTIVAVGKQVRVPYGTLDGCVQTRDWSQIERTANEFKYYCPAVGFVVLEETAWLGATLFGEGKTELVDVSRE
jgi:hypothetical protein